MQKVRFLQWTPLLIRSLVTPQSGVASSPIRNSHLPCRRRAAGPPPPALPPLLRRGARLRTTGVRPRHGGAPLRAPFRRARSRRRAPRTCALRDSGRWAACSSHIAGGLLLQTRMCCGAGADNNWIVKLAKGTRSADACVTACKETVLRYMEAPGGCVRCSSIVFP